MKPPTTLSHSRTILAPASPTISPIVGPKTAPYPAHRASPPLQPILASFRDGLVRTLAITLVKVTNLGDLKSMVLRVVPAPVCISRQCRFWEGALQAIRTRERGTVYGTNNHTPSFVMRYSGVVAACIEIWPQQRAGRWYVTQWWSAWRQDQTMLKISAG